jgi:hypothetical protein
MGCIEYLIESRERRHVTICVAGDLKACELIFLGTSRPAATIGVSGKKRRWYLDMIRLASNIQKYPLINAKEEKSRACSHLQTVSRRFIIKQQPRFLAFALDQQSINLAGCNFLKRYSNIHCPLTNMAPMMVQCKSAKAKLAQAGMSSAPGLGLGRNLRACMVCSVILAAKASPPIYHIASIGRKAF